MPTTLMRGILAPLACLAPLVLTGCNPGICTTCTAEVGGVVSGLGANERLTLLNNGVDALLVSNDGAFTFSAPEAVGSGYDVTVQSHTPGITCSISNGSGTIGSSGPVSVAVSCTSGTERVLHSFMGYDGAYPNGGLVMDTAGNTYGTTMFGGTNNGGTVFKVSPAGGETVLYSFSELDIPQAGLTMDRAGNLYGTTSGGLAGGSVFKISAAGTATVLHTFASGATDGAHPAAALIMDGGGNLYGTTANGGEIDAGAVFKIGVTGKETVLHFFAGGSTDGAHPLAALIVDSAGSLYGTTTEGGESNFGTVFKISASGRESILHFFTGGAIDGAVPVAGLIMDSVGDLFGTTSGGGAYGDGTVFKITPTGTEMVVYAFAGGTTDGAYPNAALIMDSAENLYGTTTNGGENDDGTVFKISPTGTETVLYSFAGDDTGGHTDGARPQALILDRAGNLYGTTAHGGAAYSLGTVFMIN